MRYAKAIGRRPDRKINQQMGRAYGKRFDMIETTIFHVDFASGRTAFCTGQHAGARTIIDAATR